MKSLTTVVLLFSVQCISHADVRMPSLFSDRMVLQQKTENIVWGFADPGEKISVEGVWANFIVIFVTMISLRHPYDGTQVDFEVSLTFYPPSKRRS